MLFHARYRNWLLLTVIMFAVSLTLTPAINAQDTLEKPSTDTSVMIEQLDITDQQIIDLINEDSESDWYGIYLQGNKVGFAEATSSIIYTADRKAVYSTSMQAYMAVKSFDKTDEMKFQYDVAFDAQPPFQVRRIAMMRTLGKQEESVEVVASEQGAGYIANIQQAGNTTTSRVGNLNYTLRDHLAADIWMKENPTINAAIKYGTFNTDTLRMETETARIAEIENTIADGIPLQYFVLEMTGNDDEQYEMIIDSDGNWVTIDFGGFARFQLESKEMARQLDAPVDLFISNLVTIDEPLGDPMRVERLVLEIDAESGQFLENATGQTVTIEPDTNFYIVSIGNSYIETANQEDIDKALEATLETPADHPDVKRLAEEAIGDAATVTDKVASLVSFVDTYIHDSYTANQMGVLDIIQSKRGDCSEHSLLFTALARAVDIPARTVSGLLYVGDDVQAFGGHAWNEVVIDGKWHPVDATWGETDINATHIRFSDNVGLNTRSMARLPKMQMRVRQKVLHD